MQKINPVLVCGAGPGGLSVALALANSGIPVAVFEKEEALAYDLRAGVFHPPTLEMLDTLGVGEAFRAIGIKTRTWQVRDRREGIVAEFDLNVLKDRTRYPYRLHCEQHKLTPLLLNALRNHAHAEVTFGAEAIEVADHGEHVTLKLRSGGTLHDVRGCYVIGADGARSVVRKSAEIAFEGFTWPERYLVASIEHDMGALGYANASYVSDPQEWCALMHMPSGDPGLWRLCFPIRADMPDETAQSPAFVKEKLQGLEADLATSELVHINLYKVHQRVAERFNSGRLLILGDAAHLNNPLGGMGVNSAIHDAMNLSERLVRILRGEEKDAGKSLDQYSRQRRAVTVEFVQRQSIRNKKIMEETDPEVRARALDDLRAQAADPERSRSFLLDSSMISSVARAEAIA